jgi:hypothetical protein
MKEGDGQPAKHICDGGLCGSSLPGHHRWQLLSLLSQGIEPLMISFFGKGNGVNCKLGTSKFSQRK